MEPTQQSFVGGAPTGMNTPSAPQPLTMGKWKASLLTAKAGWSLLMKDREMLLFPVLSLLITIFVFTGGAVAYVALALGGDLTALREAGKENAAPLVTYGTLFVAYVIMYFIAIFFQTGVVAVVNARINGGDFSFGDGLNVAFSRVGRIFLWALVAATVGVILRMIADRSKWLGKLVTMFLGAVWSIATFFIVPVLVLEEGGIGDAIKISGETIRRTWGESLIVNFGAGLVFTLLGFGGVLIFFALAFLGAFPSALGVMIGVIVLIAYLIVLGIISSTLDVIFRVVLYHYAKRQIIAEGFLPELVQGALGRKT